MLFSRPALRMVLNRALAVDWTVVHHAATSLAGTHVETRAIARILYRGPGQARLLLPSGCEGMARQGALPSSVQDPHLLAEMRKRLPARHPNIFEMPGLICGRLLPLRPQVVNGMPAPGRAFRAAVLIGGFPRSEVAFASPPGLPSFLAASPARRSGKPQRPHRQPAPGGRLILATRRSPGAARVRGRSVRLPPAGAASGPIIRRLMMTPLDRAGRNVTTIL